MIFYKWGQLVLANTEQKSAIRALFGTGGSEVGGWEKPLGWLWNKQHPSRAGQCPCCFPPLRLVQCLKEIWLTQMKSSGTASITSTPHSGCDSQQCALKENSSSGLNIHSYQGLCSFLNQCNLIFMKKGIKSDSTVKSHFIFLQLPDHSFLLQDWVTLSEKSIAFGSKRFHHFKENKSL